MKFCTSIINAGGIIVVNIELVFSNSDEPVDLAGFAEYLRGLLSVDEVRLRKFDQSSMSIHDGIQFAVAHADALAAVAAGIGAYISALGRRASVEIRKDGAVIARNLASRDAAKIADSLKR
jgi:hypothetical protein